MGLGASGGAGGLSSLLGANGGAGLSSLLGGNGGIGLSSLLAGGKAGKAGKAGRGGQGLSDLFAQFGGEGRSLNLLASERHGKGKDGKGKNVKGKGKGKDSNKESAGSSLLDTLSDNLLGKIIEAVLNLLTGAASSLNPLRTALETKVNETPLPNPLTDP